MIKGPRLLPWAREISTVSFLSFLLLASGSHPTSLTSIEPAGNVQYHARSTVTDSTG
jgi:hypothetical protein